jgi:uncharacterized repeat protein (TIGR02543 family)
MRKRILCAVVSLALIFGLTPTVTFAQPADSEQITTAESASTDAQDTLNQNQNVECGTGESTPAATTDAEAESDAEADDEAAAQLTLLGGQYGKSTSTCSFTAAPDNNCKLYYVTCTEDGTYSDIQEFTSTYSYDYPFMLDDNHLARVIFFVAVKKNTLLSSVTSTDASGEQSPDYYSIDTAFDNTRMNTFPKGAQDALDAFKKMMASNDSYDAAVYLGFTLKSDNKGKSFTIKTTTSQPTISVVLTGKTLTGSAVEASTELRIGDTVEFDVEVTPNVPTNSSTNNSNTKFTVTGISSATVTIGGVEQSIELTQQSNGKYKGTVTHTVNVYDVIDNKFTATVKANVNYECELTFKDKDGNASTVETTRPVSGSDQKYVNFTSHYVVYDLAATSNVWLGSYTLSSNEYYAMYYQTDDYLAGEGVPVISETPNRTGYSFTGWLYPSSLEFVNTETKTFKMPNDTVTITAQWERIQYGVTFNDNGGSDGPGTVTVDASETSNTTDCTIPSTTPTKEGYTFTGWSDGNGNTYQAGDPISLTGDITLTATWKADEPIVSDTKTYYTVTYDCDGGLGNFSSYSIEVVSNNGVMTYTIPDSYKSEKSGFTFEGWAVGGRTYQPGESIDLTGNITLVAQWEQNGTDNWKDTEEKPNGGGEDNEIGGDGIDDKYQVLVIFKAGDHGAFSSGTEVYQVFTLRDDGSLTTSGTVTPSEIDAPTPHAGYEFTGWKNSEGNDVDPFGELSVTAQGTHTFTFTAQYEELPIVTVTPQSMTAYVGGDSYNDSHTPKLRYTLSGSYEYENFKLYTVSGGVAEYQGTLSTDKIEVDNSNTYYMFPELGAYWGSNNDGISAVAESEQAQQDDYLKLVKCSGKETSTLSGKYKVEKNVGGTTGWDDWYIIATDTSGNQHLVNIDTSETELTVLGVSAESDTSVQEKYKATASSNYLVSVDDASENAEVSTDEQIKLAATDDEQKKFAATVDKNTKFIAKYADDNLGVLSYTGSGISAKFAENSSSKNVSLLVDDLVETDDSVSASDLLKKAAAQAGGDNDLTIIEYGNKYEFKYLDLVNSNDGNARLSLKNANDKVTIYWPYPDDISSDTASNYTFQVLQFAGLDRSYTVSGSASLANVDVENLEFDCTENGIKFETSSFSPFVLLWADADDNSNSSSNGNDNGNGKELTDPSDLDNNNTDTLDTSISNSVSPTDNAAGTAAVDNQSSDGQPSANSNNNGQVAGSYESPTSNASTDTQASNAKGVTGKTTQKSATKSVLAKTGDAALVLAGVLLLIALISICTAIAIARKRKRKLGQ